MENENKFSLESIRDYFVGRGANYHSVNSAQQIEKVPYGMEFKLSTNLSGEFTELIRQAARCNRYASDIVYDIENINDALETQGVIVKQETYKYALVCDSCGNQYKRKRWCEILENPPRYKCGKCNGNLHTICLDGNKTVWAAYNVK